MAKPKLVADQERRDEILTTVNEAMHALSDDSSAEQLDLVMLAAGFNPKAVRSFARVLVKQESAATGKPPRDIDGGVKWARSYLASAVDDLFAAGGSYQAIMLAAQSLPSYVAKVEVKVGEKYAKRKPTPGNGVPCCQDESES